MKNRIYVEFTHVPCFKLFKESKLKRGTKQSKEVWDGFIKRPIKTWSPKCDWSYKDYLLEIFLAKSLKGGGEL